MHSLKRWTAGLALSLGLVFAPLMAYAASDGAENADKLAAGTPAAESPADEEPSQAQELDENEARVQAEKAERAKVQQEMLETIKENERKEREAAEEAERKRVEAEKKAKEEAERKKREATDKVLSYDKSLIAKVGTQEATGHTICCPSFSCAYGDVVIDGTCHDHSYYTCSCCTWPDWGGGNSSFRCVGTNEELLREAYDQIKSGKPTVIHVSGPAGEHWICLIGYQNAKDPDHLALSNFIALDPWDGAKIVASDRYALYGDGCEHVSSR